ncbi:hypothetical protein EBZ35_08220 [bacterium]|nr:hypothetical protein [bacterium]
MASLTPSPQHPEWVLIGAWFIRTRGMDWVMITRLGNRIDRLYDDPYPSFAGEPDGGVWVEEGESSLLKYLTAHSMTAAISP